MYSEPMRIDFHVHSEFSHDAKIRIKDLIDLWKREQILSIVCDHNTMRGSRSFWKEFSSFGSEFSPIHAEEITTTHGEIIGLFLQEEIPPMKSAHESIDAVREQGGLVLIPHPFDTMRKHSIQPSVLDDIITRVDIIEGFNARTFFKKYNEKAARYGDLHNKPLTSGSDAHFRCEIGKVYTEIKPFDNPKGLLCNLRAVRFHDVSCCPIVHIFSKLTRALR